MQSRKATNLTSFCENKGVSRTSVKRWDKEFTKKYKTNNLELVLKIYQQAAKYFPGINLQEFQIQAIVSQCLGNSTLTVNHTGSGKSLVFQVVGLMQSDLTIVISPIIALMQNQVSQLNNIDINAALYHSQMNVDEQNKLFHQIKTGKLKFLYLSPEKAIQRSFLSLVLQHNRVSFVVLDEAECCLNWGFQFREAYLLLPPIVIDVIRPNTVHLTTATITPQHTKEVASLFRIKQECISVHHHGMSTNVYLNLHFLDNAKKREYYARFKNLYKARGTIDMLNKVTSLLSNAKDKGHCVIVFCKTKILVEELYHCIVNDNSHMESNIKYFHSNVDNKSEITDWFLQPSSYSKFLISTTAFGLGIHCSVEMVILVGAPRSPSELVQLAGRCGRNGGYAECVILVDMVNDLANNENECKVQRRSIEAAPNMVLDIINRLQYQKQDTIAGIKSEGLFTCFSYLQLWKRGLVTLEKHFQFKVVEQMSAEDSRSMANEVDKQYNAMWCERESNIKFISSILQRQATQCINTKLKQFYGCNMDASRACGKCYFCSKSIINHLKEHAISTATIHIPNLVSKFSSNVDSAIQRLWELIFARSKLTDDDAFVLNEHFDVPLTIEELQDAKAIFEHLGVDSSLPVELFRLLKVKFGKEIRKRRIAEDEALAKLKRDALLQQHRQWLVKNRQLHEKQLTILEKERIEVEKKIKKFERLLRKLEKECVDVSKEREIIGKWGLNVKLIELKDKIRDFQVKVKKAKKIVAAKKRGTKRKRKEQQRTSWNYPVGCDDPYDQQQWRKFIKQLDFMQACSEDNFDGTSTISIPASKASIPDDAERVFTPASFGAHTCIDAISSAANAAADTQSEDTICCKVNVGSIIKNALDLLEEKAKARN